MVEDDEYILQLTSESLSREGYRVTTAEDGRVAWEALTTGDFDLMVTDNNMPRLTGIELIKKIRATHLILPIIMATGCPPQQEFADNPWLQPAAVLLKPCPIEEYLKVVKDVLAATAAARTQPAPSPDQQGQPSTGGIRP